MKIKVQKNIDHPEFLFILVDSNPWKEVCKKLFIRYLGNIRECQTKSELNETFDELERKVALHYVLRRLSYGGDLTDPIRDKLREKKISPNAIEYVIEKCEEYDYLNDDRESKNFIKGQLRRGVGPHLIAQKLKQRSAAQFEKIRSLTDQMTTKEEQLQTIQGLIARKYAKLDLSEPKNKQKAFNFLRRRGFPPEYILDQLP